jgi:hypothetical protein
MESRGEKLRLPLPGRRRLQEFGRIAISYVQENVLLETPRDHPPDFEEKVQGLIREGRYWPVILGTHKSHPAGFPLIEEADYLAQICNPLLPSESQIKGSLLLIANTMHGGQSDDIVEGLKHTEAIFRKYQAEPFPVLRKKDAKHFTPDEKREYQKRLFAKLGNIVKAGQVPIVLPEATVESGRQKPGGAPGQIKGMVYLEPGSVALLAQMIRRQKKEPLFFFVGTTGENKIYDPITEKVALSAKMTAIVRATDLGRRFVPPIMSSVVDYPVSYSQLQETYGSDGKLSTDVLEWVCGERLAQLLPPHERGVFSEPELLDMAPHILRRDISSYF